MTLIGNKEPIYPELYGLVMAGGESRRMGENKAFIVYHKKPQVYEAITLLNKICRNVFISCKKEHGNLFNTNISLIHDLDSAKGPMAGILAAFQQYPDKAWLVLPCDLPFIDLELVKYLLTKRVPGRPVTLFSSEGGRIEPLVSIWEPKSYEILQKSAARREYGITKCLSTCEIEIVKSPNPEKLKNINTMQEYLSIPRL